MPRIRKARVTLRDIAEDTGYSITAVSHALNDRSDISPAAKEKIMESASRLGYIVNRAAASLQSGKTKIIAVIVGDTANPHFAFMTKIIENLLRNAGYFSFFMNTDENEAIERQCLMLAAQQNVDGIIWCPVQSSTKNLQFLEGTRIPFVLIGRYFPHHSTNYVTLDDTKSGRLVAEHLIEKGIYKTIYIDTAQQNSSSRERYGGFISAYRDRLRPFQNEVVYFDTEGDYFRQMITEDGIWKADAFVAYNDVIAWDVITRTRAHYKPRSPLSIAGFDNLHSFLPLPFPLTSVSSSKVAMPHRAVDILLRQIDHPDTPLSHLTLDVQLIDRHSIYPPEEK